MLRRKRTRAAANAHLDPAAAYNIPRFAFVWLLIAISAVLLPHVARMPFWLTAICVMCIAGRLLIYQGRMSFPSSRVKTVIVLIMLVLVISRFGRDVFSTDATVGVLLTGITLKLLEMQRKRDVLMVLYLCYFTIIAQFIYSQSIPVALYMGVAVLIITSALMSLNQTQDNQSPWRTLRYSSLILIQSVPLMLAIFVLFPRIAPLWSVPLQTSAGRTGLDDSMKPGDIGNLARSAEVAFRVKFESEPPPYNQLYWRAITMEVFNGEEWRSGGPSARPPQPLGPGADELRRWYEELEVSGPPIAYNVIMEPTNENWVFTLMAPRIVDERLMMSSDYQVFSPRRITNRYSYDVRTYLEYRAEAEAGGPEQARALNLPVSNNRAAREFAERLHAETGRDNEAYARAVLDYFGSEAFTYTLSPALLGPSPVDDFLFNTQEGFCEHYASAFTFLMRAAGIPARVVTGYMGGEYNPYDETLTVRQYDAHAWSEIWLEGRGWVRYDPTSVVAPQRIELGSDAALEQEEGFLNDQGFSLLRFRNNQLFNELRYRIEMIDYAWNRFVLNYDQDMQYRFFSRLFGEVTKFKILMAVLGFMAITMGAVLFTMFRTSPETALDPASRHYLRFCRMLAGAGYVRKTGETPTHFMQRIGTIRPQWRSALEEITLAYMELAYRPAGDGARENSEKLKALKRKVRRFRLLT